MTEEEGFLRRWSRRKQEAAAGQHAAEPVEPGSEAAEPAGTDAVPDEEAQNRAAAEAIDLDTLDAHSDYTVFLKKGVPAALKTAALRKLWRSDPIFANLDGLNDYDQDFNAVGTAMKEFKSAWQVGRGYAAKFEAIVSDATEAEETVAAAGPPDAVPLTEAGAAKGDGASTGGADATAAPAAVAQEKDSAAREAAEHTPTGTASAPNAPPRVPLRRRMEFR